MSIGNITFGFTSKSFITTTKGIQLTLIHVSGRDQKLLILLQ